MEQLEKILKQINGGWVLDVGSGQGEFIHFITNFGSYEKITALDTNKNFEEYIKKIFPKLEINFVYANAKDLPFEDETFDTVCISNSLHHLDDMTKILQEMKRVLKPGGCFIINEMHCDGQNEAQMSHVLLHHWFAKIDTIFDRKHDPTFTKKEIKNIVDSLNLSSAETIEYSWIVDNPKEPEMQKEREKLVDMGLKKLPDEANYQAIRKEGEKIRQHIREHGFAPAGALFILGKK